MIKAYLTLSLSTLLLFFVSGCSDDEGGSIATPAPPPESVSLLEQFGAAQNSFNRTAMQALLDFEDQNSPVALLQMTAVTDADLFAEHDQTMTELWQSLGAQTLLSSSTFAQMLGDRYFSDARLVQLPNINMLLDAIRNPTFTQAMNQLAEASSDLAWVLGIPTDLPFDPSGSYFDPELLNLDRQEALQALGIPSFITPPPQAEAVVDMLIDDSPSPFWMVNLISYRDQAMYADGRETDLTGEEANAIYGAAIIPQLLAYNSAPEFSMPVSIVLSNDDVEWDSAAVPRYASRDAFLNIFQLNPGVQEDLEHKDAGVESTLVFATSVANEEIPAPEAGFLYNFRYCEVLLVNLAEDGIRADVYNSLGLGTCPQEDWDALDADAIAAEYGAISAGLNGIRFWVLDSIENTGNTPIGSAPIETFGGTIPMRLAASVLIATDNAQPDQPNRYEVNQVSRNTIFRYSAGRQVYELENPDGTRYMMQSFTQELDPDQQLVDLQSLGTHLDLPAGWSFHVRLLREEFELPSVDGIAEVITDDFGNTYQRIP